LSEREKKNQVNIFVLFLDIFSLLCLTDKEQKRCFFLIGCSREKNLYIVLAVVMEIIFASSIEDVTF